MLIETPLDTWLRKLLEPERSKRHVTGALANQTVLILRAAMRYREACRPSRRRSSGPRRWAQLL